MKEFPLRHVSVRVPWHDAAWSGTVCAKPHLNGACAKLKGIAAAKNDSAEVKFAGRRLDELQAGELPACVNERGAFMAPFEMDHVKRHALAVQNPKNYGHFRPTPQRYPAYSAGIVPFRWLMRENIDRLAEELDVDCDAQREPDLGYESNWVHEATNQAALLDAFAGHLRKEQSLCLFYAKHVPFVEGTGRILVGAGRIKELGPLVEYAREGSGPAGLVWERPMQHSIRPDGQDGFLMPYGALLAESERQPDLDLTPYIAQAPDDHWDEFSYGSELVTHDGAIAALLALDLSLERMHSDLGIATQAQRSWVHCELVRLWKVRGPCPGLGAVLKAMGLERGIFIGHALQERAGENTDPWPQVEAMFGDPKTLLPQALRADVATLAPVWKGLPQERRAFLKLLSRFELTQAQASHAYEVASRKKRGWTVSDGEILANPYCFYEASRHDPEGIRLLTIDRGVFPEDCVRVVHPLASPSQLESALDLRRVRAFAVAALEVSADGGDTVLSVDKLVERIKSFAVRPACGVTGDILSARGADLAPEVVVVPMQETLGFQLARYRQIRELVRKNVEGRLKGVRHAVPVDWSAALASRLGKPIDAEDQRARAEKLACLKELAEARFSVLAGPAGAGKTTVLGVLCAQPEIADDAILMLAPTGKARVRMQQLAAAEGAQVFTVAQFLNQHGRYDGRAGRYVISDRPNATGYGTVIVDESSMLTEDMLGALFDALQGVKRFILVGDPSQLPPIGAGRPFVDIIARLKPADNDSRFPRTAPSYAELTIERRQVGADRADLRLARWFSAVAPGAGEDEIFGSGEHKTIRFVEWNTPEEFQAALAGVLKSELGLTDDADQRGFNRRLGAVAQGDYDYFNASRDANAGSVAAIEDWQILSPLRGTAVGVGDVNRWIHARFRASYLDLATRFPRSIPKPFGAERIVYGDKVINLANHRRDGKRVYPQEGALGYLANGEIGIAVGQWKTNKFPKILKVEFSSQPGYTYDFYGSDFRDEGDAAMELAYALTIHKSQGSQFKLVIVVLPEGHPIISRELIYTALTRHEDRVVIMHQGPRSLLKDFASPLRSETARRMTNLLADCRMVEVKQPKGSLFFQEGLIHVTSVGVAVRSMSELAVAEALTAAGQAYEYEKPLTLGGATRYPDFTIDDEISGRRIYWEHLGMLENEAYRHRWEAKLAWYRVHGVLPESEGGGPAGMLVTSKGSGLTGFDQTEINAIVARVFAL